MRYRENRGFVAPVLVSDPVAVHPARETLPIVGPEATPQGQVVRPLDHVDGVELQGSGALQVVGQRVSGESAGAAGRRQTLTLEPQPNDLIEADSRHGELSLLRACIEVSCRRSIQDRELPAEEEHQTGSGQSHERVPELLRSSCAPKGQLCAFGTEPHHHDDDRHHREGDSGRSSVRPPDPTPSESGSRSRPATRRTSEATG